MHEAHFPPQTSLLENPISCPHSKRFELSHQQCQAIVHHDSVRQERRLVLLEALLRVASYRICRHRHGYGEVIHSVQPSRPHAHKRRAKQRHTRRCSLHAVRDRLRGLVRHLGTWLAEESLRVKRLEYRLGVHVPHQRAAQNSRRGSSTLLFVATVGKADAVNE